MRTYRILFVGLLLATMGSLVCCRLAVLPVPRVVCTHAVFGEFVQVVGTDRIEVTTIIPSGFCPAHYDLCPSDIAAVANADLVFYSGFEPWMNSLLESTESEAAAVQLPDPWYTPEAAVANVDAIAAALSERFPEDAAQFDANAEAYKAELGALGETLHQRAEALRVSAIPVVCVVWQESFVSWLGFDVATTYGRPEGLSLKDLVALAEEGKRFGAQLVIDNLQSGVEFGAKLAHEIGAVHVVLSNFPGAMPRTATVLGLFTRNAEALFSAIDPIE